MLSSIGCIRRVVAKIPHAHLQIIYTNTYTSAHTMSHDDASRRRTHPINSSFPLPDPPPLSSQLKANKRTDGRHRFSLTPNSPVRSVSLSQMLYVCVCGLTTGAIGNVCELSGRVRERECERNQFVCTRVLVVGNSNQSPPPTNNKSIISHTRTHTHNLRGRVSPNN